MQSGDKKISGEGVLGDSGNTANSATSPVQQNVDQQIGVASGEAKIGSVSPWVGSSSVDSVDSVDSVVSGDIISSIAFPSHTVQLTMAASGAAANSTSSFTAADAKTPAKMLSFEECEALYFGGMPNGFIKAQKGFKKLWQAQPTNAQALTAYIAALLATNQELHKRKALAVLNRYLSQFDSKDSSEACVSCHRIAYLIEMELNDNTAVEIRRKLRRSVDRNLDFLNTDKKPVRLIVEVFVASLRKDNSSRYRLWMAGSLAIRSHYARYTHALDQRQLALSGTLSADEENAIGHAVDAEFLALVSENYILAKFDWGCILINNDKYDDGILLSTEAANANFLNAQIQLVRYYATGLKPKNPNNKALAINPAEEKKWLLKAADNHHAESQFLASIELSKKSAENYNPTKAFGYLKESATEHQYPPACFRLAELIIAVKYHDVLSEKNADESMQNLMADQTVRSQLNRYSIADAKNMLHIAKAVSKEKVEAALRAIAHFEREGAVKSFNDGKVSTASDSKLGGAASAGDALTFAECQALYFKQPQADYKAAAIGFKKIWETQKDRCAFSAYIAALLATDSKDNKRLALIAIDAFLQDSEQDMVNDHLHAIACMIEAEINGLKAAKTKIRIKQRVLCDLDFNCYNPDKKSIKVMAEINVSLVANGFAIQNAWLAHPLQEVSLFARYVKICQQINQPDPELQQSAIQNLAVLADEKNILACRIYGNRLLKAKKYKDALKYFEVAAYAGDAFSQHKLSVAYAKGEGVPVNNAEAGKWLSMAAENHMSAAQGSVAIQCFRKNNAYRIVFDPSRGLRYLKAGAENQSSVECCHSLALMIILVKLREQVIIEDASDEKVPFLKVAIKDKMVRTELSQYTIEQAEQFLKIGRVANVKQVDALLETITQIKLAKAAKLIDQQEKSKPLEAKGTPTTSTGSASGAIAAANHSNPKKKKKNKSKLQVPPVKSRSNPTNSEKQDKPRKPVMVKLKQEELPKQPLPTLIDIAEQDRQGREQKAKEKDMSRAKKNEKEKKAKAEAKSEATLAAKREAEQAKRKALKAIAEAAAQKVREKAIFNAQIEENKREQRAFDARIQAEEKASREQTIKYDQQMAAATKETEASAQQIAAATKKAEASAQQIAEYKRQIAMHEQDTGASKSVITAMTIDLLVKKNMNAYEQSIAESKKRQEEHAKSYLAHKENLDKSLALLSARKERMTVQETEVKKVTEMTTEERQAKKLADEKSLMELEIRKLDLGRQRGILEFKYSTMLKEFALHKRFRELTDTQAERDRIIEEGEKEHLQTIGAESLRHQSQFLIMTKKSPREMFDLARKEIAHLASHEIFKSTPMAKEAIARYQSYILLATQQDPGLKQFTPDGSQFVFFGHVVSAAATPPIQEKPSLQIRPTKSHA